MAIHDWTRFLLRIPINAGKKTILDCWTSQEGLESWFLRKAQFFNPDGSVKKADEKVAENDTYEWMWHGYADAVNEKGRILLCSSDVFKFSFGKAGNVTVSVTEEQGQNILELVQDEIPTDENSRYYYYLGCSKGWVYHLTNLKSLLEGGLNLTNRNMELKDVINS